MKGTRNRSNSVPEVDSSTTVDDAQAARHSSIAEWRAAVRRDLSNFYVTISRFANQSLENFHFKENSLNDLLLLTHLFNLFLSFKFGNQFRSIGIEVQAR